MNTPALPACRHRGAAAGADLWSCHSPKLVLPRGLVSGDTCRLRCPFVDHPAHAAGPSILGHGEESHSWQMASGPLSESKIITPASNPQSAIYPAMPRTGPISFTNLAIGVTVTHRTPPTLGRCLASLQAAGFGKLRVFADNRFEVSPEDRQFCAEVIQRGYRFGAWRNFVQTARDLLALEPDADGVLVVQDDAVFCRNVAALVAQLDAKPDTGVILLGTPAAYAASGRGLVPLTRQQASDLKAAWALLFPRAMAQALVNHDLASTWQGWANRHIERPEDRKGIDTFVGRVMSSLGRVCYACVPSLTDHVGFSTIGHGAPTGSRAAAMFPGEKADALSIDHFSAFLKDRTPSVEKPVSACLLSWQRPQNMQKIVDSLSAHSFIDEILVWNNNPRQRLDLYGAKVRIINSSENMICYGRFLYAKLARNEIIYVQDDDVIVRNVPTLYRLFLKDDSCITYGLSESLYQQRDRFVYPEAHNALIGFGAFFKKDWIRVLEPCIKEQGIDYLFKREADKFFSILLGRHHNPQPGQLEFLEHMLTPGIALWREPQHRLMNSLAVRRALSFLRRHDVMPRQVTWNVVITCHNYGRYLREAVDSVLLNHVDYVITIVDDASEDETPDIAQEYCNRFSHASYIRLEQRSGVGRARNAGVRATESEFVVFLDADDRIGQHYLFAAERILRSGWDVASPDAIHFGEGSSRYRVHEQPTFDILLNRNAVSCVAAFRRCFWERVGGVDEQLQGYVDYDFWLRLAKAGARIRRLPGDHFYYRKHGYSLTTWAEAYRNQLLAYIKQKHATYNPSTTQAQKGQSLVDTNPAGEPDCNLGKWDRWYDGVTYPRPFGRTTTYLKAAEFLQDMDLVEDWGCGLGWFRRFIKPEKYRGIDGSHSRFADCIVDLCDYRSSADAILLRHVLEHNYHWHLILQNAIRSFKKKMCLILFTPFAERTIVHYEEQIAPGKKVPYLHFARQDIIQCFENIHYREESVGQETIFYLIKQ